MGLNDEPSKVGSFSLSEGVCCVYRLKCRAAAVEEGKVRKKTGGGGGGALSTNTQQSERERERESSAPRGQVPLNPVPKCPHTVGSACPGK